MNEPIAVAQAILQNPAILAMLVAVGLVTIAKGVNEIQTLIDRNRQKPEPREVQDEARTSHSAISERVSRVETIAARTREDLAEHLHAHPDLSQIFSDHEHVCSGKIHKRIDEVAVIVTDNGASSREALSNIKESLKELRGIVLKRKGEA